MTHEAPHRIRQQTVELHTGDAGLARELQQRVGRMQRRALAPLLDDVCTALSPAGRLHRIDSVSVDLGTIPADDFEPVFTSRLRTALTAALAAQIERAERESRARGVPAPAPSALEAFEQVARTGALPWWADPGQADVLGALARSLLADAPRLFAQSLAALLQDPRARHRIAAQCDDATLAGMIALLRPEAETLALPLVNMLCATVAKMSPVSGASARGAVWRAALYATVNTGSPPRDARGWASAVLQSTAGEARTGHDALLAAVRRHVAEQVTALPEAARQAIDAALREVAAPAAATTVARGPEASTAARRPAADAMDDVEELYLDTAGLVILWPFVARFFENLGLCEHQRFKDEAAVHRAVGLLHHLATGDAEPPEHRVALAKVLCGMELQDVLDFGPKVTEAEAEAASAFLGAVIANAPILKEMSIRGFRGTFVLREGILETRDGAWLLRVERQTHDVVLDRFPWSWSWVRLPWMAAPLRVEW